MDDFFYPRTSPGVRHVHPQEASVQPPSQWTPGVQPRVSAPEARPQQHAISERFYSASQLLAAMTPMLGNPGNVGETEGGAVGSNCGPVARPQGGRSA